MVMRKVFVCAFVLVLLSGCDTLRQTLNIENPTYRLRDLRPRVSVAIPFSASTIDLDFTIEVQNPNPVGLRLDRIDFDLLVNDRQITRGFSSERIRVPANGFGDVRIRTRVGYNDLRSLFQEIAEVIQGERARYELRGRAYYDTPIGSLNFPLTVYSTGSDRTR
jgi:LEA14-like dessication related protein